MDDHAEARPIPESDSLTTPEAAQAHAGLSKTQVWRKRKAGDFPREIRLGPKCVRYSLNEVLAWVAARKAGRAEVAKEERPRNPR
jgi:predicted DNA-binding transcriptional regulator AlpA